MEIISPEIEEYAQQHTGEPSGEITELVETSRQKLQHLDMISGRIVGKLLMLLIRISKAKRALEIGTFIGYTTLRIAEALPEDGTIITCDNNERYEAIARSAFRKSPNGHKITMKMGPAAETIRELNQTFDFIFIDADKNNYPLYYKELIPKLTSGGVMAVDNVLWSGKVLNPDDDKSRAIDRCNKIIAADDSVEQVMLPVRDGLTVLWKK